MNINHNAPVVAKDEIIIHAPIENVWAIQTDIEKWSEWQPDISSTKLEGKLEPGTIFRWKAQGLAIKSTLEVVIPCQEIGWTGISMGMKAEHLWHFEATTDGTRVITEESLSGWLTRLLAFFDRKFLEKSMANSLAILKERAEKSHESD